MIVQQESGGPEWINLNIDLPCGCEYEVESEWDYPRCRCWNNCNYSDGEWTTVTTLTVPCAAHTTAPTTELVAANA